MNEVHLRGLLVRSAILSETKGSRGNCISLKVHEQTSFAAWTFCSKGQNYERSEIMLRQPEVVRDFLFASVVQNDVKRSRGGSETRPYVFPLYRPRDELRWKAAPLILAHPDAHSKSGFVAALSVSSIELLFVAQQNLNIPGLHYHRWREGPNPWKYSSPPLYGA
jgi:hypothetical protein